MSSPPPAAGNADGTQNNTVSVDSAKLETKVNAADRGSSVVVTVPTSTGSAKTQLVVKDVDSHRPKDHAGGSAGRPVSAVYSFMIFFGDGPWNR